MHCNQWDCAATPSSFVAGSGDHRVVMASRGLMGAQYAAHTLVVAGAKEDKPKGGFGLLDGLEAVVYGLGALAVLLAGAFLGLRAIYRLAGLPGVGASSCRRWSDCGGACSGFQAESLERRLDSGTGRVPVLLWGRHLVGRHGCLGCVLS